MSRMSLVSHLDCEGIEKPPTVLGNARVLDCAIVDETVVYSGHGSLWTGSPGATRTMPSSCAIF